MSRYIPVNEAVDSVSITHKFDKPQLIFLNTSDVENGKIISTRYCQTSKLKGQAKKTIKKDDILFSEIRPKNRHFAYVNIENTEDYVVSTKLMVLRNNNPEVNSKYVYYFLTNQAMLTLLQNRAENRICSFPQITFDLLSDYKIRIPELKEQERIVEILSSLDSKIELNNCIKSELEAYATTLYNYWFVQYDYPDSNGKPYKNSGGKMVWNKELHRNIPENWEIKRLEECSTLIMGQSPKSESYNTKGNGTPLVNGAADYNNSLLLPNVFTTSPTRICKKNDMVFCIRATIGNLTFAEDIFCLGRGVAAVRPNDPRLDELVYFFLLQEIERFKKQAVGSIIVGITKDDLADAIFTLPSEELLTKFHSIVSPIFLRQRSINKENQKLIELKNWLLPMLMNGQVRVN